VRIGAPALSAQYMTMDKPAAVVLFELARAMVTGKTPTLGEVKEVPLGTDGGARSRAPFRRRREPVRNAAPAVPLIDPARGDCPAWGRPEKTAPG